MLPPPPLLIPLLFLPIMLPLFSFFIYPIFLPLCLHRCSPPSGLMLKGVAGLESQHTCLVLMLINGKGRVSRLAWPRRWSRTLSDEPGGRLSFSSSLLISDSSTIWSISVASLLLHQHTAPILTGLWVVHTLITVRTPKVGRWDSDRMVSSSSAPAPAYKGASLTAMRDCLFWFGTRSS